jgi:hypothetical protein
MTSSGSDDFLRRRLVLDTNKKFVFGKYTEVIINYSDFIFSVDLDVHVTVYTHGNVGY